MKLTFAGIASFCAGLFLSFGFARSYYQLPTHTAQAALKQSKRSIASVAPVEAVPPLPEKARQELATPKFAIRSALRFTKESGVFVRWSEVPKAAAYKVTITDSHGRKVREFKTKRSFTLLKTLGADEGQTEFSMRVAAIGKALELGPPSAAKSLLLEITQGQARATLDESIQVDIPETGTAPAPATHAATETRTPALKNLDLKPPTIKSISSEE